MWQGFAGPEPAFEDFAPAAGITLTRHLQRKSRKGAVAQTVRREADGSLRVTSKYGSWQLAIPLVRWLEQENTVLTWRQLPSTRATDSDGLELCLIDSAGNLLWRNGSASSVTTPPPAAPHDYGGAVLGRGSRLRRQSLTSPSGSHTLLHHNDGNLVLYCNSSRTPVWMTGTGWLGDSWVDLTPRGGLVLRTSCGAPVWQSGTAGTGVERLAVGDDGSLALLDGAGTAIWQIHDHAPCTAGGNTPPRGSVLRRGQTLRAQSLTSVDGDTVLQHQPGRGVGLFRDGNQVWHAPGSRAADAGLTLNDGGFVQLLAADGSMLAQLAGPGDHLAVVPGGEARLCADDGTVLWREGHYVIDGHDGIAATSPRAVTPAALEALLNTRSTPIVRTDFSDEDAWENAWRDISAPREYFVDDVVLDATLVARRELEGWTGGELAILLSHAGKDGLVFAVDAVTLASPEHPVLVMETDPQRELPRSFRATPHALVDVETQLSTANMDWEDFSESADSDGILRTSTAD